MSNTKPKVGSTPTPPPVTRAQLAPDHPLHTAEEMSGQSAQPPAGRHAGQTVRPENVKPRPKR